jgi:hypothetical protein
LYEEGIDFVAKIVKLLAASLGNDPLVPPATQNGKGDETEQQLSMSGGTLDILRFLNYVAPYFHPSNLGS